MINVTALKECLKGNPEVIAAYLFGSAARVESAVNDLDIMVLLRPSANKYETYINLRYSLSKALRISEGHVDILFFDLEEADPTVLFRAVNQGILLENKDPDALGDKIDALSRYFLENEPMLRRAKRLRLERLEAFCAN